MASSQHHTSSSSSSSTQPSETTPLCSSSSSSSSSSSLSLSSKPSINGSSTWKGVHVVNDAVRRFSHSKTVVSGGGDGDHFILYTRRWFVLILFSLIALFNNVICYTFAAVHSHSRSYFDPSSIPSSSSSPLSPSLSPSSSSSSSSSSSDPESLSAPHLTSMVSCFFFTYCLFSFPSSWLIENYGLRTGVILGSWMQVVGCGLRAVSHPLTMWLHSFVSSNEEDWLITEYNVVLAGQIIASIGQAFFVNPPALLASIWFGARERTIATTIAVNANTLGIAAIYLTAPRFVQSRTDIPTYLLVLFMISAVLAILALFFPTQPPTPPSRSQHTALQAAVQNNLYAAACHQRRIAAAATACTAVADDAEEEDDDSALSPSSMYEILKIFTFPGFLHTLIAFALAEATINSLSAFMSPILHPLGYNDLFIGYMASVFIGTCMLGSAIIGYVVDRTRWYKPSIVLCGVCASVSVIYFVHAVSLFHVVLSIGVCGFFIGPLQPIAIEAGVECTFPTPGSSVTAVQQVLGNLASAAVFPAMLLLATHTTPHDALDMQRPLYFIAASLLVMALFYCTFNGRYARLAHEQEWMHRHSLCISPNIIAQAAANGTGADSLLNKEPLDSNLRFGNDLCVTLGCTETDRHCHLHEDGPVRAHVHHDAVYGTIRV